MFPLPSEQPLGDLSVATATHAKEQQSITEQLLGPRDQGGDRLALSLAGSPQQRAEQSQSSLQVLRP